MTKVASDVDTVSQICARPKNRSVACAKDACCDRELGSAADVTANGWRTMDRCRRASPARERFCERPIARAKDVTCKGCDGGSAHGVDIARGGRMGAKANVLRGEPRTLKVHVVDLRVHSPEQTARSLKYRRVVTDGDLDIMRKSPIVNRPQPGDELELPHLCHGHSVLPLALRIKGALSREAERAVPDPAERSAT